MLEGLAVATQAQRSGRQGSILPCKTVCVRKFLTPQHMKEKGTTKTWKAKSRTVRCGNFASENQAL
eukprot:12907382-Prorocentrum_lima.AAC.1